MARFIKSARLSGRHQSWQNPETKAIKPKIGDTQWLNFGWITGQWPEGAEKAGKATKPLCMHSVVAVLFAINV